MTTEFDRNVAGLTLAGEFLGTTQQADRTVGDKTYAGRFIVKLLADDRVFNVEYKDEQTAQDAAGIDGLHRGDWIQLPVGVRAAKGYTFFFGRRGSGDEA